MADVERYEPDYNYEYMEAEPLGDWVRYSAYEKLQRERDQALAKGAEEERERQGAKWQQAIDFLLGSMGEYGESREGKAYKNALIFIRALDKEGSDD